MELKISTTKTPINIDLVRENRKHRRVRWKGPIHVVPILYLAQSDSWEIPEKGYRARGLDIGEGGMRLALPPSFPNTEYVKVRFNLRQDGPSLNLILKRIWMRDYVGGFSYLTLDETERQSIRAHVHSKELPESGPPLVS